MFNHFEQTVKSLQQKAPCEIWWKLSGQVVSEKKFKDYMVLNMYIAKEQGPITTTGKSLIVTKKFYYFNHTLQISATSL